MEITPDGTHAYVANSGDSTVSVIDTATGMVSSTIPVGIGPFGVAFTPDGTHAYVANYTDATVSVIDSATGVVSATIPVGMGAIGVATTPDGKHVYVSNQNDDTVSVIDTATGVVSAPITVGSKPSGVAITPDGEHAYVANNGSGLLNNGVPGNTVSVITTATGVVSATVTVGNGPLGVAVTPDGRHVYVANGGDNTLSVITRPPVWCRPPSPSATPRSGWRSARRSAPQRRYMTCPRHLEREWPVNWCWRVTKARRSDRRSCCRGWGFWRRRRGFAACRGSGARPDR